MKERTEFLTRFRDLEVRWNLDGTTLSGILLRANEQLIEEILDETPFDIGNYHRDGRSNHQYIYDLIEGRVLEDIMVMWFSAGGKKAVRIGADANNKIQRTNAKRIKSTFDLEVDGKVVEIQFSNEPRTEFHIKEYKRIKNSGDLIYFIIKPQDKYFVISKDDFNTLTPEYNNAWKKNCYVFRPKTFYSMNS
jgi:hypothetical protein